MSVIGPRAAVDLAFPTGLDAGTILNFLLKNGSSAEEYVRRVAAAIGAVNAQIVSQWGGLFYVTQDLYAFEVQGESSRRSTPHAAEFGHADPVRGSNVGRMLPIPKMYEDALAWTPQYMRDAFLSQLEADQTIIADSWWNRVGGDFWTRVFTNTENLVGTTGYDVPWAIGTGTNVNYIPRQYRGNTPFTTAHTHFVVQNSSDSKTFTTLFEAMMKDMRHHGYTGRLQGFVSFDDVDTIVALANFVQLTPADQLIISSGTGTDPLRYSRGETEGVPGELFGYFNSKKYGVLELRWDERIPAKYAFVTKSFGVNNPRNGVAIRVRPDVGFGLRVDPRVTNQLQPALEAIYFPAEHAVGINDRLNGVAGYLEAGATVWVNPTI